MSTSMVCARASKLDHCAGSHPSRNRDETSPRAPITSERPHRRSCVPTFETSFASSGASAAPLRWWMPFSTFHLGTIVLAPASLEACPELPSEEEFASLAEEAILPDVFQGGLAGDGSTASSSDGSPSHAVSRETLAFLLLGPSAAGANHSSVARGSCLTCDAGVSLTARFLQGKIFGASNSAIPGLSCSDLSSSLTPACSSSLEGTRISAAASK